MLACMATAVKAVVPRVQTTPSYKTPIGIYGYERFSVTAISLPSVPEPGSWISREVCGERRNFSDTQRDDAGVTVNRTRNIYVHIHVPTTVFLSEPNWVETTLRVTGVWYCKNRRRLLLCLFASSANGVSSPFCFSQTSRHFYFSPSNTYAREGGPIPGSNIRPRAASTT